VRTIMGFHCDEKGDYVAELSCGHGQHVRHQPPFQLRPWIIDPEERAKRIGTALECPLCDRAEPPEGLRLARSSPIWNEQTIPVALLSSHRVGSRTWGEIHVYEGRMRFVMASEPILDVVVEANSTQAIPPDVEHRVEPLGPVRFSIAFFATKGNSGPIEAADRQKADNNGDWRPSFGEGGESACWAGLICPECGSVIDGSPHRPGCRWESSS
jgi:tellurite methyltransferase